MTTASKNKTEKVETRSGVLREAAERRALPHMQGSGRMTFKAIPALVDAYLERVQMAFRALGRPCNASQLEQLRAVLDEQLVAAFSASPHSWVVVDYQTDDPPKDTLSYVVNTRVVTLEQEFQEWLDVMGAGQLFGRHADAKVLDVAASLGEPAVVPVLDAGAGTGRNSLALARAGYPVTALELCAGLLDILRREHDSAKAPVRAIQADVLDASIAIGSGFRLAILSEVVSHFVEARQLRLLFERMSGALEPGGILLFNCFLAHPSYTPDRIARDVSRAYGCSVFTRKELADAAQASAFELLADESVRDYEKEHLPDKAWPPTPWFDAWTQGQDVFKLDAGKGPIEMRWLTYRRPS